MADTIAIPSSEVPDPNAEADRASEALLARTRQSPGADVKPSIDPHREDELDSALDEVLKQMPEGTDQSKTAANQPEPKATNRPETTEEPSKTTEVPQEKPAAETPSAKKGILDDLLGDAKADNPPVTPSVTPPVDPYESTKLRSDASPKTRETFEALKSVAREREATANARAADLEKRLAEIEPKLKELETREVPEDVKKELENLRAFRAQFDTENDPAFRNKYDSKIDSNYSSIYDRLKVHGLPDAEIAKLKSFSRDDRDRAIDSFLDKLPSPDRRFIESKLVDNAGTFDNRQKELAEVRSNADKILAEKAKAPVEQVQKRYDAIAEVLNPLLQQLPWIHAKQIPASAGAEERKSIEAENAFALEAQNHLREAITDDSPAIRARAAIAIPIALQFKRELTSTRAQLEAVTKELEGIKKASRTSRTANSSAAPINPSAKPAAPRDQDSGDALDSIFAEINGSAAR